MPLHFAIEKCLTFTAATKENADQFPRYLRIAEMLLRNSANPEDIYRDDDFGTFMPPLGDYLLENANTVFFKESISTLFALCLHYGASSPTNMLGRVAENDRQTILNMVLDAYNKNIQGKYLLALASGKATSGALKGQEQDRKAIFNQYGLGKSVSEMLAPETDINNVGIEMRNKRERAARLRM